MNRVRVLLLTGVWSGVTLIVTPAVSGGTLGSWTARQPFQGSTGDTIHYYLFTPAKVEKAKKYPLVMWLHGGVRSNGRGGPNMPTDAFYKDEHQRRQACFVLRPVAVKGKNWVSPRGPKAVVHAQPARPAASIAVLLELLSKITAEHPVDTASLHVVGASMGGYGVWDLIARRPKMFASAIPICGGGDPSKAAAIQGMKIWVFHSADDRIVPPRGSREMFKALMKAKGRRPKIKEDKHKTVSSSADGRLKYTEYKKGGHNSWDRALREGDLLSWVFSLRPPTTAPAARN